MDAIEFNPEFAMPSGAPRTASNRKTYASFGQDGLTATANAHGHLIQITRYFGNEPSGFICVDLPEISEPYHVTKRMKDLQRSCEDPNKGMKLQLREQPDDKNQKVDDLKWETRKSTQKIQFYQDRWPHFITHNKWLNAEVQYLISGRTVYQIYTFSSIKRMEKGFPKKFPLLMISANLLLRHLDFVTEGDGTSAWNSHPFGQNNADDHYIHGVTRDTKAIFNKHKDCETGPNGKRDATLFISPYIDDRSQSVGHIGQSVDYEIILDEQAKEDLLSNKRIKITLAYTLELASSADEVSNPLSKYALPWLQPKGGAYEPPLFVDDKHLNFTLRRNLEHILSVCSIPVRLHDEPRDEAMPIALTCGDLSGHRIAKEASFYAFQFLLKAFEHFDNSGLKDPGGQRLHDHPLDLKHAICENYNCRMRFRIWKTCRGHLAWISDHMNTEYTISNTTRHGSTEETKEQGFVSPHYWASGQVIDGWKDNPRTFFDREITDAPLQIIKFGEYGRITGRRDIIQNVPAGFESIVKHWVSSIHERNKRGAYAFPRIREEETGKFYLADHALIWWASKSLEELGLDSELEAVDNSADASEPRIIKYSSDEIKTNFIKRFTMENPTSKTRMIAISRSSAETRFSLLKRETVLFYAMDLGLFDAEVSEGSISTNKHTESSNDDDNINDTNRTSNETNETSNETNETLSDIWGNVIDEWINTVNYQAQREDQHDAHWDHPLQFALAAIISAKNKCTTSRLAARMFDISRKILFESSSPNGLFPGQLDVNKRPILFNRKIMRDSYWQATFEVPFILWKYPIPPPSVRESPDNMSESTSSDIRGWENIIKLLPGINSSGIPNNVIDQRKVVTLSDEWLYNELDCFRNIIDLSDSHVEKLSKDYTTNTHITDMIVIRKAAQKIRETIAQNTTSQDTTLQDKVAQETPLQDTPLQDTPLQDTPLQDTPPQDTPPQDTPPQDTTLQDTTLQSTPQNITPQNTTLSETTSEDTQESILGYIIDIPQKSDKRQDMPKSTEIKSIESLNETISPKRTTKNAKKRLLHFHRATDKTALICYIAAIEHPDISTFFDRHRAYDKYFHEETNAVLNLWVTELHLSFYQIISQKIPPDITCIPDFEYSSFPRSKYEEAGNHKQISRAVMSFRFDGDFFDRHWTCLFFEFNPCQLHNNEIFDITKEKITGSLKADPWKQRRVLELVLFGKILQEMVTCSQELLGEIKARILESFKKGPKKPRLSSTFLDSIDLFDEITSNIFISNNKSWNTFQYILQVVEEDLGDNLTKIEFWMKREERPEHNKPRWTLNDERNYRGAIYRLQKSNDLLVQQLRLCYARTKSFNASLTKRLDSTRGEWEVGSNDNIRLFTYVTVAFLPISFATGVFSMSNPPSKETLNSMTTTAGLALLVTVMTLLNAKVLERKIVKPFLDSFRPVFEITLRLVLRSPLYAIGLVFRLTYLILTSFLSFLPGKWIYLLRRYLISPAEESTSRPYAVAYQTKTFLDKEIKEKVQKIKEKLERERLAEEIKLAKRKQAEKIKLAKRKQTEKIKLAQRKRAEEMKLAQRKQAEEMKLAQKKQVEEMKLAQKKQAEEMKRAQKREAEEMELEQRQQAQNDRIRGIEGEIV